MVPDPARHDHRALAAAAILAYAIRNTYLLITGKGADKSLTQ
jgi:hypothetical protein